MIARPDGAFLAGPKVSCGCIDAPTLGDGVRARNDFSSPSARLSRRPAISHEPSIKHLYVRPRSVAPRADSLFAHRASAADTQGAHAQARQELRFSRDHDLRRRPPTEPCRATGKGISSWVGSSAIGTLVERTTRFTMLLHLPRMAGYDQEARVKNGPAFAGHGAEAVRDAITRAISTMPEQLRRSLTWDQGAELAQHARLKIDAGMQVYFCDPHSPWQRGTNENTNGYANTFQRAPISAHTTQP